MKMKALKGIAAMLVAVMAMSTAVFAAPSVTINGSVAQDSVTMDGVDSSTVELRFEEVDTTNLDAAVAEQIQAIAAEPSAVSNVIAEATVAEGDTIDTSKLQLLTQIQDLNIRDLETGELVTEATNVKVTWEVPNLTEGIGEVRVLHYSTVRGAWEILVPDSVDYANKAITQTFADLSPVAVVYVPAAEDTTTAGSSTETGTTEGAQTSDSMQTVLYAVIAVAAVVLIAVLVVSKKKVNNN